MTVVQPLDNGGLFHRAPTIQIHPAIVPLLPLLLMTVGSFALNTTVVTKSGTIVVFGASKNKIVVAADSRVEHDAGDYDDQRHRLMLSNPNLPARRLLRNRRLIETPCSRLSHRLHRAFCTFLLPTVVLRGLAETHSSGRTKVPHM